MTTLEQPMANEAAPSSNEQLEMWFGEAFHQLNTDKILLETDTASPEKRHLYHTFMGDNVVEQSALVKQGSNKMLTLEALGKFITYVINSDTKPHMLAFNVSASSLLVWAVIKDEDFGAERALYMAQAAVNSELAKADYRVSTTIVDESDELTPPQHYQVLDLGKVLAFDKSTSLQSR